MLTYERLLEVLHYDPETGLFTWKINRKGGMRAGERAGTVTKRGYVYVTVDGKSYLGHRLAWFYIYGVWPEDQIDHEDRVRSDNRITGLREADPYQNQANRGRNRNNTSGYKGVFWHKLSGKWMAQLRAGGKVIYLGLHNKPEEAHQAYVAKQKELAGEFARAV